jgi:hypothetical protein
MHPVRHIAFTNALRFERPRDQVFEAFLDTGKWFQISYGQERLRSVVNDRRVGGQIYEDWVTARASSTGRWLMGPTRRLLEGQPDARRRDHAEPPVRVRG